MKILVFTSLFPNSALPRHGVFVENRLSRLKRKYPDAEFVVVCPVPWFPFKASRFGEYAKFASSDKFADRGWAKVYYPRYPVIPKIGMNLAPALMALFTESIVKRIKRDGFDFDLIDAHYLYPDSVAAAKIAKKLNVPLVCTARGNDVSLISQHPGPRKQMEKALKNNASVIAVCKALADEIVSLGYAPRTLNVLRNGVDLESFKPLDNRDQIRSALGISRFTVISVGHHIERKGHHLVIEAIKSLPDVDLLIAGDGPWETKLKALVKSLSLENQVRFLGAVPHEQLVEYYNAADAMVLASSREGWANVLLESMACGTPVVATSIWGTPEVVRPESKGVLVERSVDDIARGIREIQGKSVSRLDVRKYAEQFSWDETIDKLYSLFSSEIQSHKE